MIDPMKWLETSVLAITGFNLILVFVRILLANRRIQPANLFLLAWFVIMAIAMIMMFLINTALIVHIPWLYRLPSPLYFLIFPSAYLWIRMISTKNRPLRKWDALHLLPAVLHFFEFLPFYLKPYSYKLEVVRDIVSDPMGAFAQNEGVLLDYQHILLNGIIGLGYVFAMFRLMSHLKLADDSTKTYHSEMRRLLWVFVLLQLLFALSPFVPLGFPQIELGNLRGTILYLALALTQLSVTIIFILYPNLHNWIREFAEYGMEPINGFPDKTSDVSTPVPSQITEIDHSYPINFVSDNLTAKQQLFINGLDNYFAMHQSFLNKNISVSSLANELHVPNHYLSNYLNRVIGQRFSDYINMKRIAHVERRVLNGALSNYTLEAIALESGFSTRLTFIRAIKKHKGCSPKVYFKGIIKHGLSTKVNI